MQDITVKVVRETVNERNLSGFTKAQLDSKLAEIKAIAAGLPPPSPIPDNAIYLNNVPLKINNKILTETLIINK